MINNSIASKIFLAKPWKDEEETFTPIEISLARKIINNIGNQEFVNAQGWIFILCQDGLRNDGCFLLSKCVSVKNNIRGFGTYHGIVKHQEKSIENLKNQHFSMISPETRLDARMESFFQITPDVNLKFVNNEKPSINHINEASEVVLYQKVEVGRCHLLCEDFWSQIQLLNMIKSDILNFKNNTCDTSFEEPNYKYGLSDMTFENLQEKVSHILSDVQVIKEDNSLTDTNLESVIKRAKLRPLTEITDQLWDLLKFTNSYADLKKIITFIFQGASRSNVVNIPTNKNRLGELIRELCQQRLAVPNLHGTEPLELLLEIGIEKLMKDFEFIFAESRICQLSNVKFGGGKSQTISDNRLSVRKSLAQAAAATDLNIDKKRKTLLKNNSGSFDTEDDEVRNSRFNERQTDKKISELAQIYLVTEHLLLVQNNLVIENDYAAIAKKLFDKPLITFDELPKFDKFEFVINNKKVSDLVDNLTPNAQKITFTSENKFKAVKNVFYFNLEQIIPSLLTKEKEELVGDAFHFISYTTLTSKF